MVVLITSKYKEKDNIMVAAWHSPISFDPPLYAIAIGKDKFSHSLIKKSGEFGVNFVDSKIEEAVLCCGRTSGKDKDKFESCSLTRKKAEKIKAPLVEEAVAWYECRVVDESDTGDHTLFIGEVLSWQEKRKGRLYHKSGNEFVSL